MVFLFLAHQQGHTVNTTAGSSGPTVHLDTSLLLFAALGLLLLSLGLLAVGCRL